LHVYKHIDFTKLATYSASVAKCNFGNFGCIKYKSLIPVGYDPEEEEEREVEVEVY